MKQFFSVLLLSILFTTNTIAQDINPQNIKIARDSFGVPHIFTKTDAEAAYGLAWVQAEDNFHDVQESILAVKGLNAAVNGKEGALLDALCFLTDANNVVNDKYETDISPKFKKILSAYTAGMNRFAELHPKEIRHRKLFPITEQEVLASYILNMSLIASVHIDIGRLFDEKTDMIRPEKIPAGSNGIAISPERSADGKTYLLSNSHQPLDGFVAWYEVQINTEEGWHFYGASFASGVTPFIGTNKNLGWTHCINYDDFDDVYELKINPDNKNQYLFDGQWLEFEERKLKLKVKIAGIRIPVSKKFLWSVHGPVIKNDEGHFAIRFAANMVVGTAEQWYHMNKANNLAEFEEALELQQLPSLNITYADKEGNILFMDNGLFPKRNPKYDWSKIVPGDVKETLWKDDFLPLSNMIKVHNPSCGYVFNMNNTGFDCTCNTENPNPNNYDKTMGFQTGKTARSYRFHALIDELDKVSYEDLKRIKNDYQYQFPLQTRSMENLEFVRNLKPSDYPDIADCIELIIKWDGNNNTDSKEAAIMNLVIKHLIEYMMDNHLASINMSLPEEEYIEGIRYAKKHLLKHFGTINIELGQLQKHVRGDKELPIWGGPETISAMYSIPHEKGTFRGSVGDTYIMYVTYDKNGVEQIEAINCYGSSNRKESPHYDDQMELFVNQKTRKVTMDKAKILQNAERIYSPK